MYNRAHQVAAKINAPVLTLLNETFPSRILLDIPVHFSRHYNNNVTNNKTFDVKFIGTSLAMRYTY